MKIIFLVLLVNWVVVYVLCQVVFVEECGISVDVEFDVKDIDQCEYVVLYLQFDLLIIMLCLEL